MRIFLTGGTGFIGSSIMRALCHAGHSVTMLVRRDVPRELPEGVVTCLGNFTDPYTWVHELRDHDVVINAVGIIRERDGASFKSVHRDAPIVLFTAAEKAGVQQIIQISAMGADDQAITEYQRSKKEADDMLQTIKVPSLVLRPSIVYGPGCESMELFTSLAAMPVIGLPFAGKTRLQPVHIDDFTAMVVEGVEQKVTGVVDIDGLQVVTLAEILRNQARWLSRKSLCILPVPYIVIRLVAAFTDICRNRGPISSGELHMLRQENFREGQQCTEAFSVACQDLATVYPTSGASCSQRLWYPLRLYAPAMRWSLVFIWAYTAIVSMVGWQESIALLTPTGLTESLLQPVLFATCGVEIILAFCIACAWKPRFLAAIQFLLILSFTSILTACSAELWLHPFGPLSKNIPLLVLIAVWMQVETIWKR